MWIYQLSAGGGGHSPNGELLTRLFFKSVEFSEFVLCNIQPPGGAESLAWNSLPVEFVDGTVHTQNTCPRAAGFSQMLFWR